MILLRISLAVVTLTSLTACARQPAPNPPVAVETKPAAPQPAEPAESVTPKAAEIAATDKQPANVESEPPEKNLATLEPWSEERLKELLNTRVDGGLGRSFRQFSNQFLVMSRIQTGNGIGLIPVTREVADAELQPVFPESYQPTLRELFDSIALQSKSSWKYDPTDKHLKSSVPGAVTDLAMFEFTAAKREKPYEVTLAEKWTSEDKGHWLMLIPPSFPVGLDIYEVGQYSADDAAAAKALFEKVRQDVALQWAERVAENVTGESFKQAKVGPYDALHFEAMIPSQLNKDLRWRQWVFMAGNRCFFVVSTILPELDKAIYPDVEQMLKTFRLKEEQGKEELK